MTTVKEEWLIFAAGIPKGIVNDSLLKFAFYAGAGATLKFQVEMANEGTPQDEVTIQLSNWADELLEYMENADDPS